MVSAIKNVLTKHKTPADRTGTRPLFWLASIRKLKKHNSKQSKRQLN